MSNQLIPVNFYGADLCLIDKDGEPYVAMRPVAEGIGLDWSAQRQKLQGERWKSTVGLIATVGSDGKRREMLCLPLRKLPGWLMGIEPSRVRPEIRNKVIQYQNECDDALWDYWNQGFAVNKRAAGDGFAQGVFKEFQVTRLELVQTVGDMTEAGIKVAGLLGLEGNQGRFYADKLVKRQLGVGPMELLGITSLPNASNEDLLTYTPTQLGKRFGHSGQAFNKLLSAAGLQTSVPKGEGPLRWRPTEKGKPYSAIHDTGRKHNGGGPVVELRWKESVLDELRREAKSMQQLLIPVSRG